MQSACSPDLLSTQSQSQETQRTSLSYALPSGAWRRVVERYTLDDNGERPPSNRTNTPQPSRLNELQSRDRPVSILPATPRYPAAPSSAASPNALGSSMAPKPRTYPQQPTYITSPDAPNPINAVYSPSPQLQEEICVECAMRDQDMAHHDIASPDVWERASDILFEELMEGKLQDEAIGVVVGCHFIPRERHGGVHIKPPQSPSSPANIHVHTRSQSREITLLENGMAVEDVDVRKEEREARERRRKEEKRARKSSRSFVMDVTSTISAQSNGPLTDNGLKPYSQYSHSSSVRPRVLGSGSPRRTRFFGIRNPSAGWMSQDNLAHFGMSGSMVDRHIALQREAEGPSRLTASPLDLRASQRKNKKLEDDFPSAPPPPLSSFVDRGPFELLQPTHRHASTPSVPSITSPKLGLSSPGIATYGPLQPPGPDPNMVEVHTFVHNYPDYQDNRQNHEDNIGKTQAKFVYPVIPEPNLRLQNLPLAPLIPNQLSRKKSLPPLPPGEAPARQLPDSKPQMIYTYTPRLLPPTSFCDGDTRRQSSGDMTSQPNLGLQTMPASKEIESDGHNGQDDPAINGYPTSTSRHSALSMGASNNTNLRMSVTSRKALEELVAQDPDFVAYRYPSNDQQLDLFR
ncbi:hypothetical protein K443DRAFT_684250 [Laccaria amethystina LaAM-08-1]|uniref:Uncharacterized protein n=1 Tax=Laccaria amethystina LaAM-08-1 TaxID=1095629 RepID=A0A0C9X7X2_9AGAR|nr:hypothetical protein K443DRAFT_684250 [Laccaria amethystina LaAM-08-1]